MKSLKLSKANDNALHNALDKLEGHIRAAEEVWPTLTPEQRSALLDNSPLLARIVTLTATFREV